MLGARRTQVLLGLGLVGGVAVLGASGCGGGSVRTLQLQDGVALSAAQLPKTVIRVRQLKSASLPARHAVRLSPVYRLTHVAHLPALTTIRFRLSHRLEPGYVLAAVTRESSHRWIPIPAHPSADGRFATVRVTRLSDFVFGGINVSDALRWVKKNLVDGLLGGATASASPPHCNDEAAARADGYSIASSSGSTVYWCFGVENGHRVLKVVNNRRYVLDLTHPGLSVESPGRFHLDLSALARAGAGNRTVLSPRDEAIFRVNLGAGRMAGVGSEYDGFAQSLYQLQFGVETAISLLSYVGKSGVSTVGAMNTFLHASHCASTIRASAGDVIAQCLTPSNLIQAFGFKGLLIAPVIAAGPFISFFRSELNSLGDQLNGRTHYRIVLRRSAQAPPPTTTSAPPPATTTAPPPATTQPAQTGNYTIGAPFDDECVVAWPTAPTRTSSAIEMTMTCAHVPEGEFLFTNVTYGNPNLAVTPDTGQMHVVGKVVDVAVSSYGYKELVVQATSIQFG